MTTETAPLPDWPADYAARGIYRDTWACVNVGDKRMVQKALFNLALSGVPALVSKDPDDPKRYHVAVQGGLAGSPMAWLVALRDEAYPDSVVTCPAHTGGQHPRPMFSDEPGFYRGGHSETGEPDGFTITKAES